MFARELLYVATKPRFFRHAFHRVGKFALQLKVAREEILRSLRIQLYPRFAVSAEHVKQKAKPPRFQNVFPRAEIAEAEAVPAGRPNLSRRAISAPTSAVFQKHPEKFQHGGYGFCLF